jgi:NTE family protein
MAGGECEATLREAVYFRALIMKDRCVGATLKSLTLALGLVAWFSLTGCAHYIANVPKIADRPDGYYYENHRRQNNSEDTLLLLAFSGGGTRAAAFSYGLLEALRDVTFEADGKQRRLLDEVDVISSVSGGSVTAAAYGLYGERTFDIFEPAFLRRNVDLALLGQVLNPIHWPGLWSSTYGRSDLAARYYDQILFKDARFQTLTTNNSPYLVINGTDIATGTRLSFTQHFFDVLGSDLDPYPLSRAVAASSAVPGLLTPITLNNYSGLHPIAPPAWVAKQYVREAGAAGRQAQALSVFLNATNYPYLHLVDGGVSDNLGLRVYLDVISLLESNLELVDQVLPEKIRKVIFISVNATVHSEKGWDRRARTPGSIPVVMAADARMIEQYSSDTLVWFQSAIENLRNRPDLKNKVAFYAINLDFKQFSEPAVAQYFLSLPTTFSLSTRVVDQLKAAAHTLLYQNPDFKKLMTDLGARTAGDPLGPSEKSH